MKPADFSWDITDTETIRINQLGKLTREQQQLLRQFTPLPIAMGIFYLFLLLLVSFPLWWSFEEPLPASLLPFYIAIFGIGSIIAIAVGLTFGWRAFVDWQDVRQGKIVGGHGTVSHSNQGYIANVQGLKLKTLVQKVDLLPGTYYFYFLPRSHFLLSAESLETSSILGQTELLQVLGQRFNFTDKDLIQNRNGRLSPRQQFSLLIRAAGFGILLSILLIIGPLLIYGIVQTQDFGFISIQTAGLVILLFLFLGWVGWSFLPRLLDGFLGKSHSITGPVQVGYRNYGRSAELYYTVAGQEFKVSNKHYYSLVEGLIYQVHFTPRAKRIISIEPVNPT